MEKVGVYSFTNEKPVLPPHGITSVTLRSIHLLHSTFSFSYDQTEICIVVNTNGSTPLELRVYQQLKGSDEATVARRRLRSLISRFPLMLNEKVCTPVGPVAVAGIGF